MCNIGITARDFLHTYERDSCRSLVILSGPLLLAKLVFNLYPLPVSLLSTGLHDRRRPRSSFGKYIGLLNGCRDQIFLRFHENISSGLLRISLPVESVPYANKNASDAYKFAAGLHDVRSPCAALVCVTGLLGGGTCQ